MTKREVLARRVGPQADAAGVRYFEVPLSVYRSITYPMLPEGSYYFTTLYFTESTFDLDPSTIEMMMLVIDSTGSRGTRIFREDGTVLFDELTLAFGGTGGYSELNSKPPLFVGENGITYMILGEDTSAPISAKLYQLPGSLPCFNCNIFEVGIATTSMGQDGADLALYPNPSSGNMNVIYSLPENATKGSLLVFDAAGQLVRTVQLNGNGRDEFSLAVTAEGTYTCTLVVDGRVVLSRSVVHAK